MLAFRFIDRVVDRERELRSASSVLMFTVRGTYIGYTIVSNTGIESRCARALPPEEYCRSGRGAHPRRYGVSRFFISVIAGYDR